ncbi:unnamed protein product [Paramecium primaurelia]|uniref:Serine-threonine/tyrosine-protein kinase catalytic domain-containing protein n=1 Tax=Paramecium primaurelia TaxID=5886 RepID=A0A8S1KBX4_PARPR|nr:unnamed protein product [Paramecium primaurelia]
MLKQCFTQFQQLKSICRIKISGFSSKLKTKLIILFFLNEIEKIIEIDGIKITKTNKIKHGAKTKIYEGYLNQNEQKKVALKKHKEKFTNEQILLLKILKEQINDHIIEIIAFGQTQKGKCYIVMELGNQIDLMNLANKQQTCLEVNITIIRWQNQSKYYINMDIFIEIQNLKTCYKSKGKNQTNKFWNCKKNG